MSLTLAVTGGTGFVGAHLMERALSAGHRVRALTRRAQPPAEGVTWVAGDLSDRPALARLAEGSDAVIHIAGLISARNRAGFEAANVVGTANVVDGARQAGVRRFVHASSLAAREPELSDYGWSKARSERVLAASGLDWTVVRPPAVYGPGDRETLELFRMAKKGLVALPPPGRFSTIHVDDLCDFILTLANATGEGETWEPDDDTPGGWAHDDFARLLGAAFGKTPRTVSAPAWAMRLGARLDGLVRRDKAKLTPDRARYFSHPDWVVAAERKPPVALWKPRITTEQGVRETAAWYQAQGWL